MNDPRYLPYGASIPWEMERYFSSGDKSTIHFTPKQPVNIENQGMTVSLKLNAKTIDGHQILTPGNHYELYVFNFLSKDWEKIQWGILKNENEPNKYFDTIKGIQLELRFDLEKIRSHYSSVSNFIFFISDIDLSITGKKSRNNQQGVTNHD
jgi:hypothetical protein